MPESEWVHINDLKPEDGLVLPFRVPEFVEGDVMVNIAEVRAQLLRAWIENLVILDKKVNEEFDPTANGGGSATATRVMASTETLEARSKWRDELIESLGGEPKPLKNARGQTGIRAKMQIDLNLDSIKDEHFGAGQSVRSGEVWAGYANAVIRAGVVNAGSQAIYETSPTVLGTSAELFAYWGFSMLMRDHVNQWAVFAILVFGADLLGYPVIDKMMKAPTMHPNFIGTPLPRWIHHHVAARRATYCRVEEDI